MAAQEDKTKQIAVVLVIVFVLGFVFKDKLFGKKTSKTNVRGGAGTPAGGGQAAGGGGGGGDSGAPTVTPTMIPVLTPEMKGKIKNRTGSVGQVYPDVKLASGVNPFIPYGADPDTARVSADNSSRGPTKKKGKQAFSRKMTFWGAFMPGPDEPKRVIIEVQGDPQPWTGAVGDIVEGTPYKVDSLADGDLAVVLVNPSNDKEKPIKLRFEGAIQDSRGGDDKGVDALFNGTPADAPAGGDAGAAPASPPADNLEPAFDR